MSDGQLSLTEQLQALYQCMQGRMASADLEALREADQQIAVDGTGRAMLQPGDRAPDFSLIDQGGTPVRLADRLTYGQVVVLFSRGGWCPFCTLQLRAWQADLPRLHDAGGDLLALLPQETKACGQTAERDLLAYPVLSDPGGRVAESYGVAFDLPVGVRPLYSRLGHDLPRINGTGTWRLPLSSTFIVASDGLIAMAHADLAMPARQEPEVAIAAVRGLVSIAA